ncbi:hypothetical protein P378_14255 [Desulforamulus profundi]|uniref:Uncharacterized protein n=1 Tax=Desulforamulus profundi TaxID=1383067 RepID=A0A2C6MDP2_9FIRM|nr:hypothetical protein [Desulforamulus profundi]PHJ37722.1 hypothetical protein P378_14255 [Desulforamulus profundi]
MSEIDVQFTCPDCDKTFSIGPDDILEKDSVACPHCSCMLPEEELRYLKIAINYMKEKKTH